MIDFENDSYIDDTALDLEWLSIGEKEAEYIREAKKARLDSKWANEEVKTIRSELIREANENPADCCNKAKPNAGDIEAYYRTHSRYKGATQTAIEAEDHLQEITEMKDMIHFTKTKALEHLVELYRLDYFVGPRVPRDIGSERNKENKKKESIKSTGGGMTRRKRK